MVLPTFDILGKRWNEDDCRCPRRTGGVFHARLCFTLSDVQRRDGSVEFGTISTDSDALIEVYSFRNGVKGPLLGWEALLAGANSDTKVPLVSTPWTTALTVVLVDGEVVASPRLRFVE